VQRSGRQNDATAESGEQGRSTTRGNTCSGTHSRNSSFGD
jgi:hypothetical protein